MFRRIFWLLVLSAVAISGARAQYDPHFSHYYGMEAAYNPAAVGKESKLNVVGAYAMNMAGFENNPRTFYIGGDMPFYALNSYHGVGINLMNDQIGIFTHQRVAVDYSYKVKMLGGTLGIGLQAGFLNEALKASDVDVETKNDPAFSSSDTNGNALDLAAGLYFQHGRWYAGASVQHLTSPLVELGELNELKIDRTYYLTGGYNIKLRNPFLSIPVTMLGMSDGVSYRADVTARLVYNSERRMLFAGVGYSPTNSVTVLVGGSFHGINVGYSYEAYTNGISLGNGSHELFVSYQTDLNLYKKGKNKHKSVRLL
ncbi:MAG: type IX secretion system membrane protein PorP/SprF [Prevotella sp.]|nr:type IX secretion system membrane protein PorP/SprF [Prevotella sp.]